MRTKKNIIIVSIIILIATLYLSFSIENGNEVLFGFFQVPDMICLFVKNLSYGLLASSFIATIIALIEYHTEKNRIISTLNSYVNKISNIFNGIPYIYYSVEFENAYIDYFDNNKKNFLDNKHIDNVEKYNHFNLLLKKSINSYREFFYMDLNAVEDCVNNSDSFFNYFFVQNEIISFFRPLLIRNAEEYKKFKDYVELIFNYLKYSKMCINQYLEKYGFDFDNNKQKDIISFLQSMQNVFSKRIKDFDNVEISITAPSFYLNNVLKVIKYHPLGKIKFDLYNKFQKITYKYIDGKLCKALILNQEDIMWNLNLMKINDSIKNLNDSN